MTEAQGRVARYRASAMQDLRNAIGGHAELARQLRRAHIECFEFFGEVLTRLNGNDWHGNFEGLAGGGFGRLGGFAVFADHADEGLGGAGEAAVAAVDEP